MTSEEGPARPDVAVIGGGIVGTAAAAALAAAGARVTLFEIGGAVAAGASGRNAGEICQPPDPAMANLFHESLERYRALDGESLGGGETFRVAASPIGVLEVAFDGELVRRVAASLGAAQPDLCPEILTGAELADLEPLLHPGLTAFRIDTGYPVRPADATRAFAAYAVRHGASIRTNARARPWVENGVALGVETDGARISAGSVIVAAGPWTPELVDPSGRWRPISPLWGVIVELFLDPAPSHVIGELLDDRSFFLAGPSEGTATADVGPYQSVDALPFPILGVNPAPQIAGGVAPTGLGGTLAPSEPDARRVAPTLVEHARRFMPSVDPGATGPVRACARPQSLDGRPLIGRVPGVEGLFVAAGNGAWGISTGPATARMVADAVLTGDESGVPPELSAGRFGVVVRT